jgi:glutathione synthase/RimK-type ligase-like ATP-grasp enzyme
MIVLWGLRADTPLAMVDHALTQLGETVFWMDQAEQRRLSLEETANGAELSDGEHTIALEEIAGVYLRPFDTSRLPEIAILPTDGQDYQRALSVDMAFAAWCQTAPVTIVNRPDDMASNNSKPYQSALIVEAGFAAPDTLVTTDEAAVRDFVAEHGAVIYKSCSGVRSIVSRFGPEDFERLKRLPACPTQFQAFVPGTDVRVHVVGEEVFATEIRSDADDYRYAARCGVTTTLRAFTLDTDIAHRARTVTRALGLSLSGIDLRRTPDGEWVCFEVNPSPGFSYYQQATGQPIAAAVADLLMTGSRCVQTSS